ncbi:MAG: aspartate aminotransferase family protein [Acidobacteriota bacterium]|nr:aspartate aminotransferase family protein [Acidobacteriota bacterium]
MSEQAGAEEMLDAFFPYRRRFPTFASIPESGVDRAEVLAWIGEMAGAEDAIARAGRVSGSIYHGGREHFAFLARVFERFAHANVLQRDMYPSASKFESEIVAMTAALLHGEAADGEGDDVCGTLTFGGSESLFDVVLVYRERGRERGIERPRLIVPVTAHVALNKAAHYLGVEIVSVPVGDDQAADPAAMRAAIDGATIGLVGSAGTYPHGAIDPIGALSEIALEHDLPLHVDACMGGYILPFAERLGGDVPAFDFRLPGVTSISADTHKFGYGPKGAGVMLYRNRALRHLQYFTNTDWPGGLYASPGIAGSRSGGIIAATWAALVTIGERGYLELAERILATTNTLRDGVAALPELRLLGRSPFMVAFGSEQLDVMHVNDALKERGWRMNALQHPPGLHFCVTAPNTREGVAERFLEDLVGAVSYAKGPPPGPSRSGAIYGGAISAETLEQVIDAQYELAPAPGGTGA